jgi:hypothetical protein
MSYVQAEDQCCPPIRRIHYDIDTDFEFDFGIRVELKEEEFEGLLILAKLTRLSGGACPIIKFKDGSKVKFYGRIGVPEGFVQFWGGRRYVTVTFGPEYVFIPRDFGAAIKQMWI